MPVKTSTVKLNMMKKCTQRWKAVKRRNCILRGAEYAVVTSAMASGLCRVSMLAFVT
jgi:hypothetical protein